MGNLSGVLESTKIYQVLLKKWSLSPVSDHVLVHVWAQQWPQAADALPSSASCAVCKAGPATGQTAAPFAALIWKDVMKRARRQLVVSPCFWRQLIFLFRKEKKVHIFPSLTGPSKQFSIHSLSWGAVGSSGYKVNGHMNPKTKLELHG